MPATIRAALLMYFFPGLSVTTLHDNLWRKKHRLHTHCVNSKKAPSVFPSFQVWCSEHCIVLQWLPLNLLLELKKRQNPSSQNSKDTISLWISLAPKYMHARHGQQNPKSYKLLLHQASKTLNSSDTHSDKKPSTTAKILKPYLSDYWACKEE
jgi:hypothetical protein